MHCSNCGLRINFELSCGTINRLYVRRVYSTSREVFTVMLYCTVSSPGSSLKIVHFSVLVSWKNKYDKTARIGRYGVTLHDTIFNETVTCFSFLDTPKIRWGLNSSFRNLRTDSVTLTNAVPATTTSWNPAETMSVNHRRITIQNIYVLCSVYIWCKRIIIKKKTFVSLVLFCTS